MRATPTQPLRVALIGWGAIGQTVGRLLRQSADADRIELVAVGVQDRGRARRDFPAGVALIDDPDEMAAHRPNVVAEAAGRDSVEPWGRAALACGADLIVSSVSAFADQDRLAALRALADRTGTAIHIQPGAIAGVDALAAARLMGIDHVEHRIIKPPAAWAGTEAAETVDLDALAEPAVLFVGSASQTAAAYPKNANVAMTTALAGIGPDQTVVSLIADPGASNRHEISARGAFGHLDVKIANSPLPDNPKTSAMAALALVRAITHRAATIVV